MKKIFALLMVLAACVMVWSCEKETVMTIDQSSLSFSDAGGSQTISLSANKAWSASSNQSWCKVSPSAGEEAASSRITISCDANTTYDARSCTVTFTCAEMTKTVSISQATNNGLLVSQTSYELTKAAQQLNIEVKANVKFSVEVDKGCKDWVKYSTTKGLTTNTVVLDIAENKTYDGREGKVTIKQDGGSLLSTVNIKQSQLDGLFVTTSEYNLSNEKHTLTVEVSTNVEFDVKPEADWVKYVQTKGLSTKQIVLEVAENDTYDQRETKVNVKQKNGDLSGVITIKQGEKYGILVSQPEFDLSNEAATIDVEVKYNVDFEVVIPDDCKSWIKQVSTKSLNSKTYTFSIAKNETCDNREGSITFKQKNGAICTTVAVKQAQTDYLEVVKKEYSVDIEGEIITIDVTSNVAFTVTISEDSQSWLSMVDTKGLSQDKVQIAVASGNEDTDRKGAIVVAYGDMKHTITVHQYSYAANTIIQFADEKVKAKLVEAFDTNKDGELSIKEARAVKSIEGVFGAIKTYKSFDEFQYFTGVTTVSDKMFEGWRLTSIILPESIVEIGKGAFMNCTSLSIIQGLGNIKELPERLFQGCESLTQIEMPNSISSIGAYAFFGCKRLIEVRIPDGLTTIGTSAFFGCESIMDISIPDSVVSIGSNAFTECKSITTIAIPEGITELPKGLFCDCESLSKVYLPLGLKHIKGDTHYNGCCFGGCISLTHIDLPEGLESIGDCAFEECTSLKKVIIPDSVQELGSLVFYNCTSLSSVKLPNGIKVIYRSTFYNCKSLQSISIPESVCEIGPQAFYNCSSLNSINIPESVCEIGPQVFYNCSSLNSINIPESVTHIYDGSFWGCSSLTNVVIPESVTMLGTNNTEALGVFEKCTGLFNVSLPESLTQIGKRAFKGCDNLKVVVIPDSVTEIGWEAFSECSLLESVTLSRSINRISSGLFANCVSLRTIDIPGSVTEIAGAQYDRYNKLASGAFEGCTGLLSVNIPYGVTSIGSEAFAYCTGLSSITIPGSLSQIADAQVGTAGCFMGCTSLKEVILSEGVQKIGHSAFIGCTNLTTLVIPNSLIAVAPYAFSKCHNINKIIIDDIASWCNITFEDYPDYKGYHLYKGKEEITNLIVPEHVTTIKDRAFLGCQSLISVKLPDNLTSLGNQVFENCENLKTVTLPVGLRELPAETFYGCTNLTEITIPNSVTAIGWYAFNNCISITSMIIPESVTTIGGAAFSGCTNLINVSIKGPVEVIDLTTFSGCTKLSSITLPDGLKEIGGSAFYKCSALESIIIPLSVISIKESAFYECSGLKHLTVLPITPPTLKDRALDRTSNCPILVPIGSVEQYKAATGWNQYSGRIQAVP